MRRHAVQTIFVCLVVVLAGCTGLGGLGGSGDDGTPTASNAGSGGDGGSEPATSGGGNATAADSGSSSGSGTDSSGDADTAAASGSSGSSSSSNAGGESDSSGDSESGPSNDGSLDAEEEWFNLSKPGRYVFEIESAEEGTGRMAFEVTDVENGRATVTTSYKLGGDSAESTVTGPVGEVESQLVTSPIYGYLVAIQLGGIGAGAVGGEDLAVGDRFSQQSAEGSMEIEVTGTESYAGVDCYVVETRINGTLTQEVCTQQAFSSAPYVAIYDENGSLDQRVELVEYERD
ncbi:hypothetical protein [Halococcus hamelinensis]|uniref:Lipoprotein n=1 Tax=Halococcus hamelinensis 100A6 TaxID=1132509 RepID=M0LRR4_9EURY|nr:hypothetical protein [Halococcus hamelinensis]EMA35793.1 hypothetical protein C447_16584 [Halococcus hamelinensis 100A6]